MTVSAHHPITGLNQLVPVDGLIHRLDAAALVALLGLALAAIAARVMRARHLHWSWAAGALAACVIARPLLGGSAPTLLIAAAGATLRGRRWHRSDRAAGGDLAALAARRLTPLGYLRRLTDPTRVSRRQRGATAAEELLIGHDERGRAVRVPFAMPGTGRHALILGATGSGKTVTQTAIAVAAVERGMGLVVLDPKGDESMRWQLAGAAQAAGRRFSEWTPAGELVYNPCAHGGETEIADKVLAGERFTEPHYLRQAQRYLGHVVRALRAGGEEVSLRAIVEQLDPQRLELLARALPERQAAPLFAYLDSLTARQVRDLAGVRDRLAILVESDVGPWLDPQTAGAARLVLPRAVQERDIVCFRLESDTRPLLAQMLGAAIVQDLQTTVAALQGAVVPTIVVIDEFSAVAAEQVVRLFARARSAGFSLVLGTQEISDLRIPGRERLLEQVLGNLSLVVAHRQVVPASAELVCGLSGSEGMWRTSHHSDGRTTRTRVARSVLEPDSVMDLGAGWAAVIVLGAGAGARITRVRAARS